VVERRELRDRASRRHADEVRAGESERLDHADRVVDHVGRRVARMPGLVRDRPAGVAMVVADDEAPTGREPVAELVLPEVQRRARAHDQQDRRVGLGPERLYAQIYAVHAHDPRTLGAAGTHRSTARRGVPTIDRMAALPEPTTPFRRSYVPLRLAIVSLAAALIALIFAPPVAIAPAAVSVALVGAHVARHRLQRRRYERRHGFLPEPGRDDLPPSGAKILYRVELGQRGTRVCLMVAKWVFRADGWHRADVVHHAWVDGEDPVAIGEARAQAQQIAERAEADAEDGELLAQEAEARVESWLYDAREARRRTAYLLKQLTRDPD
jgi:hypothetical protein